MASRIYLLEPQWNPSIELQAIGRALRLGQTDHVTIVRYIMKNTVEEVLNSTLNPNDSIASLSVFKSLTYFTE